MSGSNSYCCVPQCNSWIKRDPTLSFHSFPPPNKESVTVTSSFGLQDKIDRRQLWIRQLKMGKNPSPYMKVCSLHFNESDFFPTQGKIRRLKQRTYPTKNLPITTVSKKSSLTVMERQSRMKKRQLIKKQPQSSVNKKVYSSLSDSFEHLTSEEIDTVNALLKLGEIEPPKKVSNLSSSS